MNSSTELNKEERNKMLTVPVFLAQFSLVELSASSNV